MRAGSLRRRASRARTWAGAQVSSLHAGFLINTGGATAGDFLALMERVQRAVYEREGVRLEPEVRILGQDGAEEVGRE